MNTTELLNEVCRQIDEDTTILKKRIEKLEYIIEVLKNSYDGVYSEGIVSGAVTRHTWAELSTKIEEFDELLP